MPDWSQMKAILKYFLGETQQTDFFGVLNAFGYLKVHSTNNLSVTPKFGWRSQILDDLDSDAPPTMMIKMKTRVQKSSIYEAANNNEDKDNDEIGRKNAAHNHESLYTM